MIAQSLTLSVAASIAALRATAGSATTVVATTRAGYIQLYTWNAASIAPDDGIAIVAPNAGVAGRWILSLTLDNALPPSLSLVMAIAWTPPRGALTLAPGWRVVGADATNIYITYDGPAV